MGKLNGSNFPRINGKSITKIVGPNGKTATLNSLHVPARAGNKPDNPSDRTRWPFKMFIYGGDGSWIQAKFCVITDTAVLCAPRINGFHTPNGPVTFNWQYNFEMQSKSGIGSVYHETSHELATGTYHASKNISVVIYNPWINWSGAISMKEASILVDGHLAVHWKGKNSDGWGDNLPWNNAHNNGTNYNLAPAYMMKNLQTKEFDNWWAVDMFTSCDADNEGVYDLTFYKG